MLPTIRVLVLPVLCLLLPHGPALASALQDTTAIQQAARTHAVGIARRQGLVDIQARAQRIDRRLRLANCGQALKTSSGGKRVTGRLTVSVRCPDKPGWSLYVPVKIDANVRTVVLRNSLPRGSALARGDIELRKQPVTTVRSDYIGSIDDAVGMALRRPVRAGSILYLGVLETPAAVQRGQVTDLFVAAGGVQVKMQGTALASGAPGEVIKVRNSTSGKTVEGVVTPEGWVRIP